MTEVLAAALRANLIAALAIVAVLILRGPARRRFGADIAYSLWLAPVLAAGASLLPARFSETATAAASWGLAGHTADRLAIAWALGSVVSVAILAAAQLRFLKAARAGQAGPAVVGVFCPRIVMPADRSLYTGDERALIRAHERAHIARGDPRARAAMAALQCAFWFNPLVHLAVRLAILDQEMACDADVLRQGRARRAAYAAALLKAQLTPAALPLGAHWAAHPLETRIAAIARRPKDEGALGPALLCTLVLSAVLLAWGSKPPVQRHDLISDATARAAVQPAMSVVMIRVPRAARR